MIRKSSVLTVAVVGMALSLLFAGAPAQAGQKPLRRLASYFTASTKAKGAKPLPRVLVPGKKVQLYFKIGNIRYRQSNGAPFKAHLVLKQTGRVVKDFGWVDAPGIKPMRGQKDQYVSWYEDSSLGFKLDKRYPSGRYQLLLTYVDKNTDRRINFDYRFEFKNGAAQLKKGKGANTNKPPKSGPFEVDVDRPGSDYSNFDLPRAEAALCRAACLKDARCKAWTYVKPGVQGPKPRCWLKTAVPKAIPNKCCTSGVRAK